MSSRHITRTIMIKVYTSLSKIFMSYIASLFSIRSGSPAIRKWKNAEMRRTYFRTSFLFIASIHTSSN